MVTLILISKWFLEGEKTVGQENPELISSMDTPRPKCT